MAHLFYIDNNKVEQEWELTTFPVSIGRSDQCDIVFDDSRVSRRHAEITKTSSGLVLQDLQSTHLTLVNDNPIDQHFLADGDHVCLGAKIDLLYLESRNQKQIDRFIGDHYEAEVTQEESAYGLHITNTLNTAIQNLADGGAVDASVLENINKDIKRSMEELKCLYEVGQAVSSEQELSKVLQLIVKHVIRATGGERGIILFYHSDTDELVPVIARDVANTLSVDERNRFSRSIARKALETGVAVVAKDTLQDPMLSSKSVVDFNIRSSICAPLLAKGRTLGILYVDAKDTLKEFTQQDTDFFMALANQSAMAIENARLVTDLRGANSSLEKKVKELQALYEVSQSLVQVNDLDLVLQKILEQSIDVIGTQRGSVLLFEEEGSDFLEVKVASGDVNPDYTDELRVKFKCGEGVAGKVVETGEGLIVNEGCKSPLFVTKSPRDSDISGMLVVPLKTKDKAIGALNLVNKKDGESFTEDDLKLLTSLATQAAVTIENFRLYHLAVFDGLTNLYVNRYFKAYLQTEFEKVKRYSGELSLLFTDIDHFKIFNDTYGHQVGDIVLIEVARLLQETARTSDLVARYGGEEFCAILPETDIEGAEIFAERLRKAVEEHKVEVNGQVLSVTISIGVANQVMSKARTKDELIKFADAALYQAKKAGRNRSMTYRPPLSSRELAEKVALKTRD